MPRYTWVCGVSNSAATRRSRSRPYAPACPWCPAVRSLQFLVEVLDQEPDEFLGIAARPLGERTGLLCFRIRNVGGR